MKSRSKTPLFLMELILMLLVFSISAAVCLQVFAGAQRISEESRRTDFAVLQAQYAAECWKASHGNLEETADKMNVTPKEDGFTLYFEEEWLHLEFVCRDMTADISVLQGEEELFSLQCEAVMSNG